MSNDHWNTPEEALEPVQEFAPIDFDPCSNSTSIVEAMYITSLPENGLLVNWSQFEFIFVNPPYSKIYPWVYKAKEEYYKGAEILMLLPLAMETKWFKILWDYCSAIAVTKKRIQFLDNRQKKSGNKGASVYAYFGDETYRFTEIFKKTCIVITQWEG